MSAFDNFGDTISNLTLYDIKSAVRKVQNVVMNYTEIEAKVREATNNEPWGASSTQLQEIADATHNYQHFSEIMAMIYKRFVEKSAEEWRQIYKSLQLLEYLVKHGAERVIDDARQHIGTIKLLRNFHFIDDKMKDQGINVRNRAKELVDLLGSSETIREERRKAKSDKSKFGAVSSDGQFAAGSSGGFGNTGKKYGGFSSDDYGAGAAGQVYGDGGGFTARPSNAAPVNRVYGDGGGTHGRASPASGEASTARVAERRERAQRQRAAHGFAEGALGSVQAPMERFDDYDESSITSRSSVPSLSSRSTVPKPIPNKNDIESKPKEVDLFSFDDEPSTTSTVASRLPEVRNSAAASVTTANVDDDDDFDDFQSASTNISAPPHLKTVSLMNIMGPASPVKQQEKSPGVVGEPVGFQYSAGVAGGAIVSDAGQSLASPADKVSRQPTVQTRIQAGPNYYASGLFTMQTTNASSGAPNAATSTTSAPASKAGTSSVKPAGNSDAFGDLLSGFKTTASKPKAESLASMNQRTAQQGLWATNKPAVSVGTAHQDDDDFGDFSKGSSAVNSAANSNGADLLF
ncbi:Epsin-3, clathrin recruitment and traffic between the Golgi and endosome [Savitreella phatthalungensis]